MAGAPPGSMLVDAPVQLMFGGRNDVNEVCLGVPETRIRCGARTLLARRVLLDRGRF